MLLIFFIKFFTFIGTVLSCSAFSLTAFAEDGAAAGNNAGGNGTQGTPGGSILYYGVMIGVFLLVGYFFLVRPEKKRKKEAQDLRDTLRPGNRITTIGGIVGTVERVKEVGDCWLDAGITPFSTKKYFEDKINEIKIENEVILQKISVSALI